MKLSAPASLADRHSLKRFDSGVLPLDDWLRRRARSKQASGASRTYVVCNGDVVVAYYALASSSVMTVAAPGRFKRNMPEPIPVVVLGRLAVATAYQGQGLGRALFKDAACRVQDAADIIGIRGILVHAISEEAKAFYIALGLETSPLDPMTLMATLSDIRAAIVRRG